MLNTEIIQNLDLRQPYSWLASWFGLGFIRFAPGTFGSLGALPFGIAATWLGGVPATALLCFVIFLIGMWAADRFEKHTGTSDNGAIVIDEVAGQLLALIPAGLDPVLIFMSFFLFRLFDIGKPWPVSWAEKKLPGASGVMCDDIFAGLYAALILIGLHYAGIG